MKCVNEACVYDDQPKVEYSRGFTIEKSIFKCQSKPKLIETKNADTPVFKTDTNCFYKDFYCDLHRSMVVWNKKVFIIEHSV